MDNKLFYQSFFFKQFHFSKPRHSNDRYAANHYIGHLLQGSAKLVCGSRVSTLQAGDVLYIPMGCRYHSHWFPDENGVLVWNSFGFTCLPEPDGQRFLLQTLHPSPNGMQVLETIGSHLDSTVKNIGLLYLFLSDVIPGMLPDTGVQEQAVQKAVAAMRGDPQASMDTIARRCGMSPAALYKAFKHCLDVTPNTMRQRLLCEKAQELLVTTNRSVEDISSTLGFSSSSYFRKVLFRHTGKTPLQLRKENSF